MMGGYKTWVAAITSACAGSVQVGNALLADPFDANALYQGCLALALALGLVGIGHKIEKK